MIRTYTPSESELMAMAKASLRERQVAHRRQAGTVTPAESEETKQRRQRALRTCHRPSLEQRKRYAAVKETKGYVPEASARIENDMNLTDGARRCARKLLEEAYRRNRAGRTVPITVSYLARALGKCRRTVQRYLRQLEEEGYIGVDVARGQRSRLCVGLVIALLAPLFAPHHRKGWPERAGKPGATAESQNHRFTVLVSRMNWAMRCMDGVFRSLMKTNPLAGLPPIITH